MTDQELTKEGATVFWGELMDQLKKDIDKQNQTSADDKFLAHYTERDRNVFELSNCARPYKTIRCKLDETCLIAELEISTSAQRTAVKRTFQGEVLERVRQTSRGEIKFGLIDDGVCAHYMGATYDLPASLSKALLEELIGVEV